LRRIPINDIKEFKQPEVLWRLHVPSLTIKEVKVKGMYFHKDEKSCSIITENWKDSSKETRIVISNFRGAFYLTKRSYYFSEKDALVNLAPHIKTYIENPSENIDKNQVQSYIKKIELEYPELLI